MRSPPTRRCSTQLLDRVTVQETGFFRHPEQFETVVAACLPADRRPAAGVERGMRERAGGVQLGDADERGRATGSVLARTSARPRCVGRSPAGTASGRCAASRPDVGVEHFVACRRRLAGPPEPPRAWSRCNATTCSIRFRRGGRVPRGDVSQRPDLLHRRATPSLFLDRLADAMDPDAYLFVGGAETLVADHRPLRAGADRDVLRVPARPSTARGGRSSHRRDGPAGPPSRRAAPIPSDRRSCSPTVAGDAGESVQPIDETGTDHARARPRVARRWTRSREAIVAFRQWPYLTPDDPHRALPAGVALDAADERPTARRAYRAALAALDRAMPTAGHGPAGLRPVRAAAAPRRSRRREPYDGPRVDDLVDVPSRTTVSA